MGKFINSILKAGLLLLFFEDINKTINYLLTTTTTQDSVTNLKSYYLRTEKETFEYTLASKIVFTSVFCKRNENK